ncbi:MAG TPA: ATP-binding protein [Candidatus Atribacteria bacterium]|nr:ATP-binding protein [Candidatus Atribacteria bacterium]HPT77769.1 ATP-binding protein [Candidatus Atribacteria bacterium]
MEDISLHVLDIIQNSISAGASCVDIAIKEIPADHSLYVMISDNGTGMDSSEAERSLDPFYTTRTTRRVGLGLPLFKAQAEASGGSLEIDTEKGRGTTVMARFDTRSIDCLPLGRMEDTMATLILCHPDIEFRYTHSYYDKCFEFSTQDIKGKLGDLLISDLSVIGWIRKYISENIEKLYGGVASEVDSGT